MNNNWDIICHLYAKCISDTQLNTEYTKFIIRTHGVSFLPQILDGKKMKKHILKWIAMFIWFRNVGISTTHFLSECLPGLKGKINSCSNGKPSNKSVEILSRLSCVSHPIRKAIGFKSEFQNANNLTGESEPNSSTDSFSVCWLTHCFVSKRKFTSLLSETCKTQSHEARPKFESPESRGPHTVTDEPASVCCFSLFQIILTVFKSDGGGLW